MQLRADQLQSHLNTSLAPVYLIFGDDPFLLQKHIAQIRQAALQQGFEERTSLVQDKEFSWSELADATQSMSLFSSKQLIELELPKAAPGKEGGKALLAYLEQRTDDHVLIVFGPRINKATQNTKWCKSLIQAGVFVPVYTPDAAKLPQYIKTRASLYQIQLQPEAIQQLATWYEGNLLALDQELKKLKLRQPDASYVWSAEELQQSSSDQSRFDIFALRDALIQQNLKQYLHTLSRLREVGTEPVLICWTLSKLQSTLDQLARAIATRQDLRGIYNRERIWAQQQGQFEHLARQYQMSLNHHLLHLLERLEFAIKRESGEDIFTLFAEFGVALCRSHCVEQLQEFPGVELEAR
ncbi:MULTISPECIES: DNA polymerase III subunit delta [Gammaproteobacteria]|uniref:DNA polymerase III subunit delta n=1 Tax=Gammaproteobacteria TaxID=1236 RepID=UPI000DD012CF|nr:MULTISPECIES: DNA polymerase III subunit delta [Gammaproteobacteria]RTE87452.1 DNA polymerase III subunit delta [Aliidiomarina sp. B3213]TCZ92763.1 DNA polymerase III subunit delta [Lysobacter sp. N42]